jgi:hypothetical protein
MFEFLVVLGVFVFVGLCFIPAMMYAGPRQFPKGHIREYDPTGRRTYADQG